MRPTKERVNLTLDDDVLENLRIYAQDDDRSLSQYINRILRAYVKMMARKEKHERA